MSQVLRPRASSFVDNYLPGHVFMALAAKHIAMKFERSRLIGHDPHPARFSRIYIGSYSQGRAVKSVNHVEGREFQDHGHAFFQDDLAGRILELFRRHLYDFLPGVVFSPLWGIRRPHSLSAPYAR